MVRGSFMKGTEMKSLRVQVLENVQAFNDKKKFQEDLYRQSVLDTYKEQINTIENTILENSKNGLTSGIIDIEFKNIKILDGGIIFNYFLNHGIKLLVKNGYENLINYPEMISTSSIITQISYSTIEDNKCQK